MSNFKGIGGMKTPRKDLRDFSWKKKFGSTSLPTQDFIVDTYTVLDQSILPTTQELCTDYSAAEGTEGHVGFPVDIGFQRAVHNKLTGQPGYLGPADPLDAAKAVIQYGCIPQSSAVFPLSDVRFADLSNYSQTVIDSAVKKEASVYTVDTQADIFDSCRDVMSQQMQMGLKTSVMVGTVWRASWLGSSQGIILSNNTSEESTNHAFEIIGQKTINGILYLTALLSSGTEVGDKGLFYFPREIVNTFLYARAFGPGSPADYQAQQWTLFQQLLNLMITWLKQIQTQLNTTS